MCGKNITGAISNLIYYFDRYITVPVSISPVGWIMRLYLAADSNPPMYSEGVSGIHALLVPACGGEAPQSILPGASGRGEVYLLSTRARTAPYKTQLAIG